MRKSNNLILMWAFISAYFFYFGLVSIMKFRSFSYYDFDLAVHSQALWNILHGSLYNSILGIPYLGNHMHLISFLAAPVYAVFKSPLTLLLLQTASLALGALPLYLIARKLLGDNWALLIGIIYLLYPGLGYTNLFEFHPTAFATLFLFFTILYYQENSFGKFITFAALSMLCQENIPLAVMGLGAVSLFTKRSIKWVLAPFLLGGAYFIAALSLVSYFNNDTVQFFRIYSHFGDSPREALFNIARNPLFFLRVLFRQGFIEYLWQIFIPVLFLPFFAPCALFPAVPLFLQHALSGRATDLMVTFHYTAEIIPFIFFSLVLALKKIMERKLVARQAFLKGSLLIIAILANFYIGPHFRIAPHIFSTFKPDQLDAYKQKLINKIPKEAKVVATFEFLPRLSNRKYLYSFHHVYMGFHTLSDKKYDLPQDTEYALIDFNDYLTFRGFFTPRGRKNLQEFLQKGGWRVEDSFESMVLLRR